MDFKRHFEEGWQNTLKYIGPVILLTFVQLVVTLISLGILGPVTAAGYIKSLLLAAREGREPDVKDLFSEMSLFSSPIGLIHCSFYRGVHRICTFGHPRIPCCVSPCFCLPLCNSIDG